jgi:segregation and condensation protein A
MNRHEKSMTPEPYDYQVDLDVFRGPLDLLLYLVKRDEVDVRDISISRVAEQFKEYLEVIHILDVERAGEFLVMAATLMEIKSRMLLPRAEEEGDAEDDPRLELVRQLIQYKRFKEAAALLDARAEQQSYRLPRQPVAAPTSPTSPPVRPVELWDLVSAFGRLMRETMALQPQEIVVDQTPLHVYMDVILRRLQLEKRVLFSSLFTPPYTRGRLVGLFLAVLELTKSRRIVPEQDEPFSDIWLSLAPAVAVTPGPEIAPATPAAEAPSPSAARNELDAGT